VKQRTHKIYEEFRDLDTPLERKQELERTMTTISDTIPVPPGAIW
jgi:hypothetical protein